MLQQRGLPAAVVLNSRPLQLAYHANGPRLGSQRALLPLLRSCLSHVSPFNICQLFVFVVFLKPSGAPRRVLGFGMAGTPADEFRRGSEPATPYGRNLYSRTDPGRRGLGEVVGTPADEFRRGSEPTTTGPD